MSSYGDREVERAFNRAADDILSAVGAPDQGVRDALNLLVNAGIHYLSYPADDLDDAILAAYSLESGEEGPLDWIKDNT